MDILNFNISNISAAIILFSSIAIAVFNIVKSVIDETKIMKGEKDVNKKSLFDKLISWENDHNKPINVSMDDAGVNNGDNQTLSDMPKM